MEREHLRSLWGEHLAVKKSQRGNNFSDFVIYFPYDSIYMYWLTAMRYGRGILCVRYRKARGHVLKRQK